MKQLILFLFFIGSLNSSYSMSTPMDEIRDLYTKVDEGEEYNDRLIELTASATLKTPVLYGYKALSYFMMAKYAFWFTVKLKHFNTGKEKLERIIKLYPYEPELRLIRYSIQYNLPSILDYRSDLKKDKIIMKSALKSQNYKFLHYFINGVLELYP